MGFMTSSKHQLRFEWESPSHWPTPLPTDCPDGEATDGKVLGKLQGDALYISAVCVPEYHILSI